MSSKLLMALAGLSLVAAASPADAFEYGAGYHHRHRDRGYTENTGIDGNIGSHCPRGYHAQVFPNVTGFRCDSNGPDPGWTNPE